MHDALDRVTSVPARYVGMEGRIGTLTPGAEGDLVVLDWQEGDFGFVDSSRVERRGSQRLIPEVVVKNGQVVRPIA